MNSIKLVTTLASITTLLSTACSAAAVKSERSVTSLKAPQIYAFESDSNGFNTKNFFYDNGEEVIAFDTQFTPETAKKSIEFLRTKTLNPISYVVITHPNPDKFNGMNVFQREGAKVIASQTTVASMPTVHAYKRYYFVHIAKMFSDTTYPELGRVDISFDREYKIKMHNGETIDLTELAAPGVSSNQTVASIAAINALIVGDLVHHRAHAWLEGGIVNGKPTPTLNGWITDLKALAAKYARTNPTVYGGRGDSAPLDIAVRDQIDYLKKADALVGKYVSSLGDRKAELQNDQAGAHYQALQAIFEKAFPGYGLGYMIQYGVYGLVNSKL